MTAVLDASAVLALLYKEPGAVAVAVDIADGAVISSVNLSEVATILIRHGRDPHTVLTPLRAQVEVVAFTDTDALTAAQLDPHVYSKGLSLGDRACLALAQRLNPRSSPPNTSGPTSSSTSPSSAFASPGPSPGLSGVLDSERG